MLFRPPVLGPMLKIVGEASGRLSAKQVMTNQTRTALGARVDSARVLH